MLKNTLVCLSLIGLAAFAACSYTRSVMKEHAAGGATTGTISDVSPEEALPAVEKENAQFIDVRTTEEYAAGHAKHTINIPLNELPSKLDLIDRDNPVYLICRSGNRSKKAAKILAENGFSHAINISGGTDAWSAANLPMEP